MGKRKTYVLTERGRSPEQKRVLAEITESGICPFCTEGLKKWHKNAILAEDEYWLLTTAMWPYDFTENHLLLISKKHAKRLGQLPAEAGTSLWKFITIVEASYGITSGSFFMRFGDPQHNGGSVDHLHAHVIKPDLNQAWGSIKVKLGSK